MRYCKEAGAECSVRLSLLLPSGTFRPPSEVSLKAAGEKFLSY
jgi:hypothetical protein